VCAAVPSQLAVRSKLAWAEVAAERLLTSVLAAVPSQIAAVGKLAWTRVAAERLLARVCATVHSQIAVVSTSLETHLAGWSFLLLALLLALLPALLCRRLCRRWTVLATAAALVDFVTYFNKSYYLRVNVKTCDSIIQSS
jgi:hypothetical protein